jgi:hypothetical protein
MAKNKTELQRSVGKLISAIQKEWGQELGGDGADFSEDVLGAAHVLLQAETMDCMREVLAGRSVKQYLGDIWVQKHPSVKPAINAVEQLLGC